ncbi:ABC transporter substrate-binding protein [Rhodococcus sp. NPDC060176]|uniref:ABC transporter substrate-binding protein n=1 Tax=Rhodococcus sp. NPDC060176 TaxID=3347062 RepID=UPI0036568679
MTNLTRAGGGVSRCRRASGVAVAVIVLAVTTTACSGGSSKQDHVTASFSIAAPASAPLLLAEEMGYFSDQGLTVELKEIANASLQIAADNIDMGGVNTTTLIQSATENVGLQAVCIMQVDPSYVMAVSDKVWESRGLRDDMTLREKLSALEGENITVSGSKASNPGAKMLETLLKKNGLAPDSIGVLSMTNAASSTAAFQNGQVGVIFQPQPQPALVMSQAPGKIIYSMKDSSLFDEMQNVAYSTIATSTKFANEHPDEVRKFCAAIGQANDYLNANPVDAAEKLQDRMSVPADILKESMPMYQWAPNATQTKAEFANGVDVLGGMGMFSTPTPEQVNAAFNPVLEP